MKSFVIERQTLVDARTRASRQYNYILIDFFQMYNYTCACQSIISTLVIIIT